MNNGARFDNHLIENRQVRIFLSSTFSDMQEERSALVKTFELLKIEASKRNVSLSVIDLRWGVTEEESKSGKVISVCLNEIENSHPFFIGILGNYYGTSPDATLLIKNPDLKERYDWIEEDIRNGMSITEMEIQYGVLRNNDSLDAVFFFKKSNAPDNNKRLSALKNEIRKHYTPNDYTSIGELCEKVAFEVRKIVDRHFPETDFETLLDRERIAQRAYINSRHSCYFERLCYYDIIDAFVRSDQQYLVFTGESGIGKSALLANWIKKNEKNPDFNLIFHFVGNSFSSNSYESILRHLCDEIRRLYMINQNEIIFETIEAEAQRLVTEVVSFEKPLVVIIDGINQMVAAKDEKLLLWLPSANKKVKFIFSTLPDDETMQTFQRRDYRVEIVMPLTKENRMKWIPEYLKRVGKSLDESKHQLERIVNDPECENTLVLRTLLDELICFGSHERLDERIDYYLSAESIYGFFDLVLQRMEDEYSADKDLVRHALILIAVSQYGLSEDELMVILGCQQRQIEWKLFYCAFYNHFVIKNGLITFSHQFIADAIKERYRLTDNNLTKSFRHEIVDFFLNTEPDNNLGQERKVLELSYQYYLLLEWDNLFGVIADFKAFDCFSKNNQPLLAVYWRALINIDSVRYQMSVYFQMTSRQGGALSDFYHNVGFFIQRYVFDFELALEYYLRSLEERKKDGLMVFQNASTYNNIGMLYYEQGNYSVALKYFLKAAKWRNKNANFAVVFDNIGIVYQSQGDNEQALKIHSKALKLREKTLPNGHPDFALSYHNIGTVYQNKGDFATAIDYYRKALDTIENALGKEHPLYASSCGAMGVALCELGDFSCSLNYHDESIRVRNKLFGQNNPYSAKSLDNKGSVYYKMGDYSKAMALFSKALDMQKMVFGEENPDVAQTYNYISLVYNAQGDFEAALKMQFKVMEIRERCLGQDHPETATTYDNIGGTLYSLDDYSNALKYCLKAKDVFEDKLGLEHPDTIACYNNIGMIYEKLGKPQIALSYFMKALKGLENRPEKVRVTVSIFECIGGIYETLGSFDEALDYFSRSLEIKTHLPKIEYIEVVSTLVLMSMCYDKWGDQTKEEDKSAWLYVYALVFLERAMEIMEKKDAVDNPHFQLIEDYYSHIRSKIE